MSRFNSTTVGTRTTNFAGGRAYKEDAKLEIASILLNSFVTDQYYRSADNTMRRLVELIETLPDKRFAAQAALFARTKYNLRSISHVAAGEVARLVKGEQWTKRFFAAVVQRPDDATEILSYYTTKYGKPIPNSLKKGLAAGLTKFDGYQLAKYRGEDKTLSLIDLVNITHPVPSAKNTEALKQLIEGTLKNTDTWEAKLTEAGKSAESDEDKADLKAEAWAELITNRKLGYMATLRNLRNLVEQVKDESVIKQALETLADPNQVRRSRVLPFRFYTAYQQMSQVSGANKVLKALSTALDHSVGNLPEMPGKTLVVIDHSGSMDSRMSGNSQATMFQTGALLGVSLAKSQDADLIYFGDTARYFTFNPADSILSIMMALEEANRWGGATSVGHGTNFEAAFNTATKAYDRIVIFSDMQGWMGYRTPTTAFNAYKKRTGANPTVFSVDLAGYGTLQFPEDRVFCLAGFSEKTLELLPKLEVDKNALVHEIEEVEV